MTEHNTAIYKPSDYEIKMAELYFEQHGSYTGAHNRAVVENYTKALTGQADPYHDSALVKEMDGIVGDKMKGLIANFQEQNNLPKNAQLDKATIETLLTKIAEETKPHIPVTATVPTVVAPTQAEPATASKPVIDPAHLDPSILPMGWDGKGIPSDVQAENEIVAANEAARVAENSAPGQAEMRVRKANDDEEALGIAAASYTENLPQFGENSWYAVLEHLSNAEHDFDVNEHGVDNSPRMRARLVEFFAKHGKKKAEVIVDGHINTSLITPAMIEQFGQELRNNIDSEYVTLGTLNGMQENPDNIAHKTAAGLGAAGLADWRATHIDPPAATPDVASADGGKKAPSIS